jgi:hypothetical protein
MKKWFFLAITLLLGLMLVTTVARACEPCMEFLSLEDTTAAADLIVVGRLVREGPSTGNGPDWIEIEILEIWKGEASHSVIRVNSWNGMCAYGIILLDRDSYLIFLEAKGEYYDAVNYGCAVRSMPVRSGQIEYEERAYSVDAFANLLGPLISRAIIPPSDTSVPWAPVLIGVILVLGLTAGFYLLLKRMARS